MILNSLIFQIGPIVDALIVRYTLYIYSNVHIFFSFVKEKIYFLHTADNFCCRNPLPEEASRPSGAPPIQQPRPPSSGL